ncbi:protein SRG1-like [Rhodamnia argentea]|uniref:Protein SRG1-like n=1 Tax=Rhodamnia argentea TaxID=178133 RepID=A0A8B8R4D7_9MYRT|nr:protein SRG1-like [Rhodamnia argentea]
MDANVAKLGGSLPVPNVQELVKEGITEVPPRYVCTDQDHPFMHGDHVTSLLQVPVIDLNKQLSSNGDLMEFELEKLHLACSDWGFFQLINHGVSGSLVEEVKLGIQEFFKLPMEEKRKFWQEEGDLEGFGQAFVVSEEQKLDWGDLFYMVSLPRCLRKPHLFPMLPSPFRDVLDDYSSALRGLAMKVLLLMAKALKMDTSEMIELFDEGFQAFRMNYYPPCPRPELVIGLTPHSDAVGLTILLQVNEMEGLEIRKEGKWIPVKPLPNAFVVNVGDILEIVTNGTYRSIEHRATVNSMKERLSIATFHNPKLKGEIGPAPSLIAPDKPALFKRIGLVDYMRELFSRELQGKSYLDVMRMPQGEKNNGN